MFLCQGSDEREAFVASFKADIASALTGANTNDLAAGFERLIAAAR
eukprot:COSAG06_NODE_10816_length_1611_cov_33.360234_2_plen_45_part_01